MSVSLSRLPRSRSGLTKAFFSACCARFSPRAIPDPKRQRDLGELRAAIRSSRPILTRPGRITIRVTARILSETMRSAAEKASCTPCLARTSSPILVLSKVIRAFARVESSARASSACSRRRAPSKLKGVVANTTVNAPSSRAS